MTSPYTVLVAPTMLGVSQIPMLSRRPDRRVLDTNQHLTCSRSRRLRHVDKLEDLRRLTNRRDQHSTHLAIFSIESPAAEIDEVATGERATRLLQAAADRETA